MAGSGTVQLRDSEEPLLRVEHLVVEYRQKKLPAVQAVSDLSFDVLDGETLGLVGESGCGKSSVARAVMQLPRPSGGSVRLAGADLTTLDGAELIRSRAPAQIIFQDPISSLNPLRRVRDIVMEGLEIKGVPRAERQTTALEVMRAVGLDPDIVGVRKPREFSGGQCQRVCIARALALSPQMLIADEPVSALDVSVQGQILNLLADMKAQFGLALLFISHDLAVVKNISDRVAVMYLGKLCEVAPTDELFARPLHPYTDALLRSVPEPEPMPTSTTEPLAGEIPSPINPPSGCRFRTRCPRAQAVCAEEEPAMREGLPGHYVACHFPLPPEAAA